MNHRVQMCRHRAAIFRQLLGSPERNNRSPHLAASTNHPVGGRYLAKLMKGNPRWGEEWRRDSWRGRKARTMWERLAGWGVGSFTIWTQRVTLETWDPSNRCQDKKKKTKMRVWYCDVSAVVHSCNVVWSPMVRVPNKKPFSTFETRTRIPFVFCFCIKI